MAAEINTFEVEFLSRQKAWRLIALFGLAFTLLFAASLLLPHDRYVRYQQLTESDLFRTRWVYERIHYDKTPIDVAIVGSSRVEAAISAPLLERELTEKFGRRIHVANLAIPEEGRNLHYLVVRELIENHPETRIILASVVEEAEISHPAFRYLGDVDDLLRAPLLINHYYFLDGGFLPYRQMSYFVQTHFPAWFGISRAFRNDYARTDMDTTHSYYLPSGKLVDRDAAPPPEKLLAGSRLLIESDGGPWNAPTSWKALNNPEETEYTKRLVDVAKQHCVEVVFVRLPFYNSPPHMYNEAFYQRIAPLLDAQQLGHDPRSFSDSGHFGRHGIDQVGPWLWNSLSPYLDPLERQVPCLR